MAAPPPGKKPGIEIMIGVGKPGKDAPQAADAGKGKGGKPPFPPKKKSATKPTPQDKQGAIAKRLAALNGGTSSTNDNAGNASGGFPGM